MKQAKRSSWSPSKKQEVVMRRVVDEMRQAEPGADDLIDVDDGGADG
jgi:hypothetical protein